MEPSQLFGGCAVVLVGLSLVALLGAKPILRKLLALNVMGSGVFLLFTAMAQRSAVPDPVPHAMVLTGIVVTAGATGLAVALLRRLHRENQSHLLPEDQPPKDPGPQDQVSQDRIPQDVSPARPPLTHPMEDRP